MRTFSHCQVLWQRSSTDSQHKQQHSVGHLPLWRQHRRQRLHCSVQDRSTWTQLVVCIREHISVHSHVHPGTLMCIRCVFPESCLREEFMCDGGRCLLPVSVCDGQTNCQDQTDEANCSHKHKGEWNQAHLKLKGRVQTRVNCAVFHRVWWEEDWSVRIPGQSKPPWALFSPAGTVSTVSLTPFPV